MVKLTGEKKVEMWMSLLKWLKLGPSINEKSLHQEDALNSILKNLEKSFNSNQEVKNNWSRNVYLNPTIPPTADIFSTLKLFQNNNLAKLEASNTENTKKHPRSKTNDEISPTQKRRRSI